MQPLGREGSLEVVSSSRLSRQLGFTGLKE